mmetsp:Transcript_95836/g.206876  ORF Transcript_95836/g.206876 Transcript_95836/m.206876 type:complete len:447 (-) Transcript_95836:191-1531(-)
MKFGSAILLASLGQSIADSDHGVWCAESVKLGSKSVEDIQQLEKLPGLSYRGQFRDFSLFVESKEGVIPNCDVFLEHYIGDDGLWVIEEPNQEAAEKTKASIVAAGQKVYYESGLSIVAGGGTLLPNITGLDGCGAAQDTHIIPVPSHSVRPPALSQKQLKRWKQQKIDANPDIQNAVDSVSKDAITGTIETLQAINSRNSYSDTLYDAETFMASALQELGFTISYQKFLPTMAPNVIATWGASADAKEWVVAGGHLDSRSEDTTDGTARAPGADDNGTGSACMLELARLVNTTQLTFNRGLRICLFTGEEQGLVGSRALASAWASEGENIYAMANADMLGYQSTPEIEQAFMDRSMSPELTTYAMDLISVYVPSLPTAYTGACCSDQQSFYENGYPSVGFFESSNSATAYPSYHKKTDLLENLNTEQLKLQTQAVTATVFSLLLD